MNSWNEADRAFMAHAIAISDNALGWASPNPAVGCVLVRDGSVLGEGWTQPYGGLHAEPTALADCRRRGHDPRGATAYVTLMPCCHTGRTPPCTDALIAAGIRRVVVACDDPHPVSGEGGAVLRAAGLAVEVGLMAGEAARVMAGFLQHVHIGLPRLCLKYAISLDGKIATRTGHSRWITGEGARADVQRLRARSDAVMVGSGTVRADNPRLTVRDGCAFQPRRVVVDAACAFVADCEPGSLALFAEKGGGVYILTTDAAPAARRRKLEDAGAHLVVTEPREGRVDLFRGLRLLSDLGVRSILCEGGGGLAGALRDADLVDEIIAYLAPKVIGGVDAPGPVGGRGIETMDACTLGSLRTVDRFGDDVRLWYDLHPLLPEA